MKFYYGKNIFDLHTSDNETTDLLKFFGISTAMQFVSLFFLNEGNITISLFITYLKCTVVNYANKNSSSLNKHYLRAVEYAIYGPLNTLFLFFFDFLFMFILTMLLLKTLWKNYYFLIQTSKIHLFHRILGIQTFWF